MAEREKKLNIQPREITEEMKDSYLDYAMSVIVQRALPDVRDGLKPVHRRILYAMNEMGLGHASRFTKCANIVGKVLGSYHPHGDMAVYDSLVRLAQNFSMRYPLIDGQGNFGSVDGDSAAAYRYTEARMTKISEELLADIEKETVDFKDNYDGTKKEPKVLPAKVPQLLLNGATGIAVGMATNIPPHNLSELVDALVYLNDNPKATNEDLMKFIKGPDFPTGGAIFNQKEIIQAYANGKGAILTRGISEIVEKKEGQYQIIISEIPYQVNKSSLIESIANLVKDKKLEGIKDIRDESDREGMRIVIDLKPDAYPQKIQNYLYKHTDLQKNFNMNMLALVDGIQPQILSLKSILELYLKHRNEVVVRRTKFDLVRAKERVHILEGLKKALDYIDAIIKTIKSSVDRQTAHQNLMKKFKLSAIQAGAILEMKLQSLAGLERRKIQEELKEKLKLSAELEALLKSPKKILETIKRELLEIKEKYGQPRRTRVFAGAARAISEEELIPDEEIIIMLTRGGYIKRLSPSAYRVQQRGGRGVMGIAVSEEDVVEHMVGARTHDNLLFFTDAGRVYQTKAYEIPEASRIAKGRAIFNFLSLSQNEKTSSILNYRTGEKKFNYLVMATKNGIIKKTDIEDFGQVRRSGLVAIKLKKEDLLRWVKPSSGQDDLILVTKFGQAIRFSEKDLRPMGRGASGVKGIRLKKGDEIVGMDVIESSKLKTQNSKLLLLIVTENGFGKKTGIKEYKKQRRGGSGIKTAKITSKNGNIVAARIIGADEEEIVAVSKNGQVIRILLKDISEQGRATQGVRIMRLGAGDKVASITLL